MGIIEDVNLVGDYFNWLGIIFYMGIFVGEYLINFFLQKLFVVKYLLVNVICWGIVVVCFVVVVNWLVLMVVWFFLGMFESCVQLVFIIM